MSYLHRMFYVIDMFHWKWRAPLQMLVTIIQELWEWGKRIRISFWWMPLSYRPQCSNRWLYSHQRFWYWRVACGYLFSLWLFAEIKKKFLLNSESTVTLINARFRSSIVFAGLVWQPKRMIKLFSSLKRYFLSLKLDGTDEKETRTRYKQLIDAFKHP